MMRRWVILNVVLGLIVLGLGVQIVRTWARTLPPVEARAPGKVSDGPARTGEGGKRGKRAQADKSTQTPTALVTAIVNKDLFDPSRTKPSETVQVVATPHVTEPPPGISLVGVRLFGRDREGFILDATQANAQRRIRSGDTVGNFTVKSIRNSSVVLVSAAGDYVTLSLEIDKSKTPGAPGAPGAPVRPGRPRAPGPAGPVSPAAGVTAGASTAAGIGAKPAVPGVVPPVPPPGTPAPPQPPPPGTVSPRHNAQQPPPNLPDGVRQKLEQMKQLNKK
jgi:hypothetical protein